MIFRVKSSVPEGTVTIPGSKSHTIRALVLGLLAHGKSVIRGPLESSDILSCLSMVRSFGAGIERRPGTWLVTGTGGRPCVPGDIIDTGNSGTSLYMGLGVAGLASGYSVFTGDDQIRKRPAQPLLDCICDLGGQAFSTTGTGCPPVVVQGRISGGETSVEAVTSQYLSSLLLAAPFADGDTIIKVPLLNEKPYVEMTLDWMDRTGLRYENREFREFHIKGGQGISQFERHIPADFSTATFFLAAAAVTGARIRCTGLDFSDSQGDRQVVRVLQEMGARFDIKGNELTVEGGALKGGEFDLNAMPDALPALSVAACFAEGETRLVNVAQARVKETDRISVMCEELGKMGADIEELSHGLVVRKSRLRGCAVNGHHDHRVVMALSVAGLGAAGTTRVSTAEAVSVTVPEFVQLMQGLGADITEEDAEVSE